MQKFVNPRYPFAVFAIPDEATAGRYREWDGGHPEARLIEWAKETFGDESGAFVDVGANCGLWTVHLSGSFRQTYAFEPNLETFARLSASVALSGIYRNRISLFNLALGDVVTMGMLRTVGTDAFDASFVQHDAGTTGTSVPIQRLSDTIFDDRVALVKIDVEGFEYEVLAGAERFLRAANLPPILFESWENPNRGQRRLADTRALLESYGYVVGRVDWPEEYLATRRKP